MNIPKYFYFRVKTKNHGTAIEVEDASNEDVVEVVRCKDCKHGRLFDTNCVDCEYRELATDADWFCADGERRE